MRRSGGSIERRENGQLPFPHSALISPPVLHSLLPTGAFVLAMTTQLH